ncbi:MAG: 6-phosphogluconate dehydrogenase, NAD-binding protein [Naasia sp.]|jgi:2-hydroxy-3-oxopropionate reductase|uniref:NAD(P)-dependent oxidoreductase n=1 Tax=Naasia sp. TaxID=2546198 RepID=UPI00260765E7|nr:NAD(P)-dependent oxidoreductase [Naasia sp.]MCU1570821.1 6-phosphogluconate dehydrogenase, NAD-binding protein [Naasia sp.]
MEAGATTPVVAFIGLGVMGLPMVTNLHRSGTAVTGYDLSPAARNAAGERGIPVADDLGALLEQSDVVVTMLPNTPHVESVVHGADGVLARSAPGTLMVDMSSISPQGTLAIHSALQERQIRFVDAPVSGGVKGAVAGTLSVMAGGDADSVERARAILQPMSSRITHMGPVGTGQATKVCNQVAVAINIQAVCEAFTLGRALGVDLGRLREAMMGGATASWVLDNLGPQMLAGDDSAGFRIVLQVKDLRLALDAAADAGAPLPAASGVLNMYLEAVAHGEGGNGNQALSRVYERLANRDIARP